MDPTDTTTSPTLPAGTIGAPAAAQPTIGFIQAQIQAALPVQYADAITAQFAGEPVAMAAPADTSATSAEVGSMLAGSYVDFIRGQVASFVPSEYSSFITSQFADAPSASGQASPAGASPPVLGVSSELSAFFAAQNASAT